jgi:hypothetical protein
LDAEPLEGDDASYKALLIVFTDVPAARAKEYMTDALVQELKKPAYRDDGLVIGEFYDGNETGALYNPSFRPFTPPVPFLLLRLAVVGDWKFFVDDDDWLSIWAHRFGATGALTLGRALRNLSWREAIGS